MFRRLLKVIDIINNSPFIMIENVIQKNKYKQMRRFCGYTKIKKNRQYINLYLGLSKQYIEKNYCEAKKYYLMAIDAGNIKAMNALGYYYKTVEKNYRLAKNII